MSLKELCKRAIYAAALGGCTASHFACSGDDDEAAAGAGARGGQGPAGAGAGNFNPDNPSGAGGTAAPAIRASSTSMAP